MATKPKQVAEPDTNELTLPNVPDTGKTMQEYAQEMRALYQTAVTGEMLKTETMEQTVRQVFVDIDRQRIAVAKRLLGLDTSWSEVKLADNSHLKQCLTEEAKSITEQWVHEALTEVLNETNKTKFKAEVKKAARSKLREYVNMDYDTRSKVSRIANDLADAAINELRAEIGLPPAVSKERR